MNYINKNCKINLEWQVMKGVGNVGEDFSRASVTLFLLSEKNKQYVPCTADQKGRVTTQLPEDMDGGIYGVELVWVKNEGNIAGSRCLQRTSKADVFGVCENGTGSAGQPATVRIKTVAASYGYDGLSAYELAVLRGDFFGTEEEFVAGAPELAVNYTLIAQQLNTLSSAFNALVDADGKKVDGVFNTFHEIENFLQGITDEKTLLGIIEVEHAKIKNDYEAKITAVNTKAESALEAVTVAEESAAKASESAAVAAESAQVATATLVELNEALQALPTEQAVTVQVAQNQVDIANEKTRAENKEAALEARINKAEDSIGSTVVQTVTVRASGSSHKVALVRPIAAGSTITSVTVTDANPNPVTATGSIYSETNAVLKSNTTVEAEIKKIYASYSGQNVEYPLTVSIESSPDGLLQKITSEIARATGAEEALGVDIGAIENKIGNVYSDTIEDDATEEIAIQDEAGGVVALFNTAGCDLRNLKCNGIEVVTDVSGLATKEDLGILEKSILKSADVLNEMSREKSTEESEAFEICDDEDNVLFRVSPSGVTVKGSDSSELVDNIKNI